MLDDTTSDHELHDTSESDTALDDTDDSTNSDGEYEKPDYVQTCWRELIRKQKGKTNNSGQSQVAPKPVQQSQVAMKKVVDGTMKDSRMKEWSFSSEHGGMIERKPEQMKQATLSDAMPIISEIRYCVPDHIEQCRSSPDYPRLAGTFLNHVHLKKDCIDL
jgi:hypothetical protein